MTDPLTEPGASPSASRSEPSQSLGDTIANALPAKVRGTLEATGGMFTLFAQAIGRTSSDMVHARFPFGEFIDRCWFLIKVALLPLVLVAVPLGVAIALQIGALAKQIGATSFVGAADAIAVMREASPIVTALVLASVGGSAVCAELGARTIREEIDAMRVLGLDPVRRLVGPLLVAGAVVSVLLNFAVIFASVTAGYLFDVGVLHGLKGGFFEAFTQFATTYDFIGSEIKAGVFGMGAVTIAAFRGLNVKSGPTGVGEAVNQSVVVGGLVLFGLNVVLTQLLAAVFPERIL